MSEWCGHAPIIEEDIALTNIALDLIGQARALYGHAAEVDASSRSEDALAYHRDDRGFRNVLLVEQPNGDFAVTIVRQWLFSTLMEALWQALTRSADRQLAAIAAKAVKESVYHVRHSAEWVIRLGDGTEESHGRVQRAVDDLWRYTGEMFEMDEVERRLLDAGVAVDMTALRPGWDRAVEAVLGEATLARPDDGWMMSGGRNGNHSEHLGHVLTEMQFVARAHPGAVW